MSNQNESSSKNKPKTPSKTVGTRGSKLQQVATDVVNEQLGLNKTTPPPSSPKSTDQVSEADQPPKTVQIDKNVIVITEQQKVPSDDDTSDEIDPAVVTLAKTELLIEKAKGRNLRDQISLLEARTKFKLAMGNETWENFEKSSDESKARNKMSSSNENPVQTAPETEWNNVNATDSVPSMQSFRPIQTSSRENSSFRASVETKQTFSQHIWFEGTIINPGLREELSEYAVDTLDGIVDWFKETQNLVEKLMANGGQVWKAWVSKLIQLKIKMKKLVTRYEKNPEIVLEVKTILEVMEFWYSHINSEAELKGTFQFIASWGDEAKTRQVMGSNMSNDFKRALLVSKNDQREKFVHQKSTLQLRTMSSSTEFRADRSRSSSSNYSSSRSKDYYKSRDRSSNQRSERRDYSRSYSKNRYPDKRDQRRGDYERRGGSGGGKPQNGENTLPVKQF